MMNKIICHQKKKSKNVLQSQKVFIIQNKKQLNIYIKVINNNRLFFFFSFRISSNNNNNNTKYGNI